MAIGFERNRGGAVESLTTYKQVVDILNDPYIIESVKQIREHLHEAEKAKQENRMFAAADQKKLADNTKSKLPGFIFQCSSFTEHEWIDKKGKSHGVAAWRHQKYGVLNGLFMVDIDHVENPKSLWERLVNDGVNEEFEVLLAFVTSSEHGLKIVMKAKTENGNLFQNQQAFAKRFNVECDPSCKDSTRLSFTPAKDDVLFIAANIAECENKDFADKWQGKYADGSADQPLFTTGTSEPQKSQKGEEVNSQPSNEVEEWKSKILAGEALELDEEHLNKTYDDVKIVDIISRYMGEEQPAVGHRHETLLSLASDLRYVLDCDDSAVRYYLYRLPFVQDLVKEGRDTEKAINSGLKYELNKYKPKRLREAIDSLKPKAEDDNSLKYTQDAITAKFAAYGAELEKFFQYYPCLSECCYSFGVPSYPALVFSGAALFGTLMTKCYYYFFHRPEEKRRLNYCIFIIADPASSKSSIGSLYKTIMKPILANDSVYNKAINDYKRKRRDFDLKKKKDRDKSELSTPVVKTRVHGSRTANGVFIEDMVNNVTEVDGEKIHLHLFTFDAELDNATAASRGGQWIDKSVFELKAFHNEEDDQHYRNIDSVTGPFDVYWNFIYTGTPFSLNKKVTEKNFGSGLSTRLAVIPLASEKFKMMPLAKQSKTNFDIIETLTQWAYKLDEVHGELPLWPLVETCWDWVNNIMQVAEQTDNDVAALHCKRVPYYGINITAPFILMRHWEEWQENHTFKVDKIDKDFCRLIMEIQYYSQNLYFGAYAKKYFEERTTDIENKSPLKLQKPLTDMLNKLPATFKATEAETAWDLGRSSANVLICRMISEGFIKKSGKGKKTKYIKLVK